MKEVREVAMWNMNQFFQIFFLTPLKKTIPKYKVY